MKELLRLIPAPLLSWYKTNKRTLAWRSDPTPYHVWVSEIMLQQTRVEAVKEYYARFIQELPTISALASCPEDMLLKLWEGLGYYSRVRNMQKTAKALEANFNGGLPNDFETLKSLPGIGEYTAGAISSIAFGKRVPAVDGNVLRVVSRLTENATPITDAKYRKDVANALAEVYPKAGKDCADFTQSLFELGALVCKPQNPDCKNCPLKGICRAEKSGTQLLYPVRPQKKEKRVEEVYVFIIETPEGISLRRREKGVLRGLNEFPSHVVKNGESVESVLYDFGVSAFTEIKRRNYVHIFTHIRWDITCVYLRAESSPFDSFSLEEIKESVSLPTAFKKCLQILEEER